MGYDFQSGKQLRIRKNDRTTLIVSYSKNRASSDYKNRKRGLERLEKSIKSGKLTKKNINNRGYNKYLKLYGKTKITIDKDKFEKDGSRDGLKGYLTNTKLNSKTIIENYIHLWQIETSFRILKTYLIIRPIYDRIRDRIDAHICISFVAYRIYKDLEHSLKIRTVDFSVKKAADMTKNMYQIKLVLPESQREVKKVLKMDENQQLLMQIVQDNF